MINRFRELVKTFSTSEFVGGVFAVAGGAAVGQAITIVAAPFLTRLFTPDDFGTLAVYQSILGILVPIAALRYEFAIPLASDDESAGALTTLSLWIVAGTSTIAGGLLWFFGERLVLMVNTPDLAPYLWLIPIGLVGAGAYQVLNYRVTRSKQFRSIGVTRVSKSVGQTATQLGLGVLQNGPLGLVAGVVVGRLMGIASLWRRADLSMDHVRLSRWKAQARRWRHFPMYTSWASLVNVMGHQAPPILLARFFVPDIVGFFSLTLKVLSLPAVLIGQAVGQVFYPMVTQDGVTAAGRRQMVERIATVLTLTALPVFTFVGLTGDSLFAWIFGSQWAPAGVYAQIMAPMLCLSFVSSPLSMFVLARERQREAFGVTLYETTLRLGVLWVGGALLESDLWTIGLYSAAGGLISTVYIGWVFQLSGSRVRNWLMNVRKPIVMAVGGVGLMVALRPAFSETSFVALSTLLAAALGGHCFRRVYRIYQET